MMKNCEKQVRKFYAELWNAHNTQEIPNVLHENISFRGSLGQSETGHAGFAAYVDRVHAALSDYYCIIEDLVVQEPKVFAKMMFTGNHTAEFMGYAPTGKRVNWAGAALFTFNGDRIVEVWVLGDLKSLESQLKENVA